MKLGTTSYFFSRRPRRPRCAVVFALLAFTLFPFGALDAQGPRDRLGNRAAGDQRAGGRQGMDAIERNFISPEIVMRLREEISLTDEQKKILIAELQSAQSDLVPLRFEAQEAEAALAKMVRESRLDEEKILLQARRVMDLEAEVRTRHLALLIRIKNLLTEKQKRMLQELRRRQRAARGLRR